MTLHERDFRDKLLAALAHPIADIVIQAAAVLAARRDPEASRAIGRALHRFSHEPHVLAGLLDALQVVGDDEARRLATAASAHPSLIVRQAAARVLEHGGRADSRQR